MDKDTKERIIQENNELKEENARLKTMLEEQQLKETNRRDIIILQNNSFIYY